MRPGGPRKCQIGYPQVEAIDAEGKRVNVAFCGQTGSGVAYLEGEYRLWIADPQGVDRWLRGRGFDVAQREYPTLEVRSATW